MEGQFYKWRGPDVGYDSESTTLSTRKLAAPEPETPEGEDNENEDEPGIRVMIPESSSTSSRRVVASDYKGSEGRMKDVHEAFDGEDEMWDVDDRPPSQRSRCPLSSLFVHPPNTRSMAE